MNCGGAEGFFKFSENLSAEAAAGRDLWEFLARAGGPLVGCHAASFFEADDAKKTLTFRNSTGPVGKDLLGVSFGYQGVAGECAKTRKVILVNDAENDPRFTKKVDYGTGFRTKSVLAVPAMAGGSLLGVMEFINAISGSFGDEDSLMAEAVTGLVVREVYIRKLEATVKQLNMRGESTINNLSGGFIGTDLEGKVIFFNPKAAEIFETEADYIGANMSALFTVCPDLVSAVGAVLKDNKTVRRQEFRCNVRGRVKVIGYSSINIKGVDGSVVGAGVIFQDITDI